MASEGLTAYRRIELQSPQDFTHLLSQSRRAARAKIAQNLPGSQPDTQADELVTKVESLVDEYILKTFGSIHDNVSINGMPPPPLQQLLPAGLQATLPAARGVPAGDNITVDGPTALGNEYQYEPFDTAMHERLQSLQARLEQETLRATDLRRTAPETAARAFREDWLRSMQELQQQQPAVVPTNEHAMEITAGEVVGKADVGLPEPELRLVELEGMGAERKGEMETAYVEAVRALDGVKHGLGDSLARAERAEKVAAYFWGTKGAA